MNQFIIYLTAGTHIESAAKHSIGLSLVVIITCNVWALQLKVKGVQYSSSEKYLFEITNICVWLIHALHYYSIFFPTPMCISLFWASPAGWSRGSGAAAQHSGVSTLRVRAELMFPLFILILKTLHLTLFQWHQAEIADVWANTSNEIIFQFPHLPKSFGIIFNTCVWDVYLKSKADSAV